MGITNTRIENIAKKLSGIKLPEENPPYVFKMTLGSHLKYLVIYAIILLAVGGYFVAYLTGSIKMDNQYSNYLPIISGALVVGGAIYMILRFRSKIVITSDAIIIPNQLGLGKHIPREQMGEIDIHEIVKYHWIMAIFAAIFPSAFSTVYLKIGYREIPLEVKNRPLFMKILIASFPEKLSDFLKSIDENKAIIDRGENLLAGVSQPKEMTFSSVSFKGVGSVELPQGPDWELSGNTYYNENLDMTFSFEKREGAFGEPTEFMKKTIEAKFAEVPEYFTEKEELGTVKGLRVGRIDGSFSLEDKYVTRDYLFFTPREVVILSAKVGAENVGFFRPMVDYVASSFGIA